MNIQTQSDQPLIEVKNLQKSFLVSKGFLARTQAILKAVDDVSFAIHKGETLGLVGESGCGKTTIGRTMIRLYEASGGQVLFQGQNILGLPEKEMLPYRRRMQMIFQDPYSSLNPRMTVAEILKEPLTIHGIAQGKEATSRVHDLLRMVGLSKEQASRFPHEFSGGQRQRIGIARALAVEPDFIICDEPISALDVSIQAQIINLLEKLQTEMNLTYLFIAHDISMVRHTSKRIAVMYLGKLVELADAGELAKNPLHPYTQALLSAVPIADPIREASRHRIVLEGDVPSPVDPPPGCRFKTRCRMAKPGCAETAPELKEVAPGHRVACFAV
ncbi:MAG TPA: peptide ABC transporter ATP-binding protein [Firmicutes bacterium]|jgi:oligopeptide transport system ATP-binding protein|nr:peptide ABC transporter ATP-binding protein [Bacillota bacterium]